MGFAGVTVAVLLAVAVRPPVVTLLLLVMGDCIPNRGSGTVQVSVTLPSGAVILALPFVPSKVSVSVTIQRGFALAVADGQVFHRVGGGAVQRGAAGDGVAVGQFGAGQIHWLPPPALASRCNRPRRRR